MADRIVTACALALLLALSGISATVAQAQTNQDRARLDVRLVADEADAVLDLVALGSRATAADWQRLFDSEGYRRLKQREAAMGRAFTDSSFRAFVQDTALARHAPALREALDAWRTADPSEAAAVAFAYLPLNARIRATIYPSIKPRTNTFVFEPRTNPAIFFYLDPAMSAAQFRNTLAHELHHLGLGSVCTDEITDPAIPPDVRTALSWMGGFAEGRAVLAAAGHPDVHPHETSDTAERAVWDRDFANAAADIERLEAFFLDIIDGRTTEEERNRRGYQFVNTDSVPQGPFYTVGYLMAVAVERDQGRTRLVESICDARTFMLDYDAAAKKQRLPRFSDRLLRRIP